MYLNTQQVNVGCVSIYELQLGVIKRTPNTYQSLI